MVAPERLNARSDLEALRSDLKTAEAMLDALAPFGIDHLDVPMTPLKVWTAMRGAARQVRETRTTRKPPHLGKKGNGP
jgi:hypothetical protein